MGLDFSRRKMLRTTVAGGLGGWLGHYSSLPAVAATEDRLNELVRFPPIDHLRVAKKIVESLKPARGERAVIAYDPTYYPELAEATQIELARAGVYPIVALGPEPPNLAQYAESNQRPNLNEFFARAKQRADKVLKFLGPLFAQTDLILWLPVRDNPPGQILEHLTGLSPARSIHCHFVHQPLELRTTDEIHTLCRLNERAILETDYAAMSKKMDQLIAALKGQTLRITNAEGTDLRLRVPPDAWFHKSDGDMSPERARQAKAIRDREIEHPGGALRFIPDAASVEGKLVARAQLLWRQPGSHSAMSDRLTFQFERGQAVSLQAEKNQSSYNFIWNAFGPDIKKVGEMVLGVNPLLPIQLPSGEPPHSGYGAGAVRVSLGNNWESGGPMQGGTLWTFVSEATLEAGGQMLIERGRLA